MTMMNWLARNFSNICSQIETFYCFIFINNFIFNNLNKIVKNEITNKDKTVRGFNLGTNIGKVSGQSIHHCHFHLIPRREGDVENPQGGVRSVIPNKQHYKRKK